MPGVSESIVREYFELNGFLVRQLRKHVAPGSREEDDSDFLVLNPQPQPLRGERAFLLQANELRSIERAIVILRSWHSDVFSPSFFTHKPEFFRFLEKKAIGDSTSGFGQSRGLLKILALPALPQDAQARDQSIAILRAKGLDAALSFRTVLAELVARVEANRNYQKSDLLQLIRILKNYDFLKEPQLDLFKHRPRKPKRNRAGPGADQTPGPGANPPAA